MTTNDAKKKLKALASPMLDPLDTHQVSELPRPPTTRHEGFVRG